MSGISVIPSAGDVAQLATQVGSSDGGCSRGLRILLCFLQSFAFLVLLTFQMLAISLWAGARDAADITVVDLLNLVGTHWLLALLESVALLLLPSWLLWLVRVGSFVILLGHVHRLSVQGTVVARECGRRCVGSLLLVSCGGGRSIRVICTVRCRFLLDRSPCWGLGVCRLRRIRIDIALCRLNVASSCLLIIGLRSVISLCLSTITIVVCRGLRSSRISLRCCGVSSRLLVPRSSLAIIV